MEIKFEEVNRLLKDTQKLLFYETQLTQATGEHFNIFEILGIGSLEVTTHSPMLAELLDPQGRHGMGPLFLEIFIKQFSLELEADSATRIVQEYRGAPRSEDSGGRIDILIKDKKSREVVIENKIYATDQEKQISRYLNERPQANVLYLTLDGHKPNEDVPSKATARLACISYKSDIILWLDACRKEAAHAPLVRETIAQYINLIKVLTGQNTNSRMNDQIINCVLEGKESLEAYFTLLRSKDDVINELLKKLEVQCKEIGAKLGLQVYFDTKLGASYGGFQFFDKEMNKRRLSILFQFDRASFRSLRFGIAHVVGEKGFEEKGAGRTPITDCFESVFGECNSNSWWPAEKLWQKRDDWLNDETFQAILSGDFKKELQEKVEKLAKILRETND